MLCETCLKICSPADKFAQFFSYGWRGTKREKLENFYLVQFERDVPVDSWDSLFWHASILAQTGHGT